MRFVDLFCGLGGFHLALAGMGHECVFASELDEELRNLYETNFPEMRGHVFGDIRASKRKVPPHDILCAGFPCQPFSKSGFQAGVKDETRGTLFHEILEILVKHEPPFVILENVGNFERHDGGRTWAIVKGSLEGLGYEVWGTEHLASGGRGLLSPHHLGYPHHRERFFVVASKIPLGGEPFPDRDRNRRTTLKSVVQDRPELSEKDRKETALPKHYVECIDHWNALLARIPRSIELPSFPIWGDEIDARYPFEEFSPFAASVFQLRKAMGKRVARLSKSEILALLPSYARTEEQRFPAWKRRFIRQNREWFSAIRKYTTTAWIARLREFPPSLRKLEWNCKGEERDLWRHVLQFRPSGLRVKRYTCSPALVAMTESQIPILGPKRRFISRIEGLRLQGFPDTHRLPQQRAKAFRALGNAVHVAVVREIATRMLSLAGGRPASESEHFAPRQSEETVA